MFAVIKGCLGVALLMGGYGFPQQYEDEDPIAMLMQQLAMSQNQGPMSEQVPGSGQLPQGGGQMPQQVAQMPQQGGSPSLPPWSEQIPGGGSSTQLPRQGQPRYSQTQYPAPAPLLAPPQGAPAPQMQGPYSPPQFNQEQGMMKNIGEGFRAAGMSAMPLEQQLQAQQLQAEYDKANQLATIKQQELEMARYQHQQQLEMEQKRIEEMHGYHEGILSRMEKSAQPAAGGITGDPKKDAYFQLLQTPNPQTGQNYKPLEALQKLNEMNADNKPDTGAQADERYRRIGVAMQEDPTSVPKSDQLWYKQYERGKQIGAAPAVQVRSEMVDVMRDRVEQQKRSVDLQIAKATGVTPSVDIVQRSQFSQELLPHVSELRQEIEEADKAGLLGPILGRGVEFMEGKVGTTGDPAKDQQYAKLRQDLSLMASGMNRVHFGGRAGEGTLKYFTDQIGGAFRSREALLGSLESTQTYLGTYASYNGGFSSPFTQGGVGPTAKPAAAPTQSTAPTAGGGDMIYAKDPQGKLHQAPKGTPLPQGWTPQ